MRRDPRPSRYVLFALLVWRLYRQPYSRQADDDLVVIDHANELRRVVEGDSLTYFLEGAVRAHRGPIQMRSEQASIFRQSQVADFQRNVHFWDATTEIYADRLLYYEVSNQALATGSVQVIDRRSGSQVAADTVLYERDLGLITGPPPSPGIVLPQDTTSQEDPFHVWADVMIFHNDSTGTEMDGLGKVLIERTDLTAVGDSLHYDETDRRVALRKEPRVETLETYLTAEQDRRHPGREQDRRAGSPRPGACGGQDGLDPGSRPRRLQQRERSVVPRGRQPEHRVRGRSDRLARRSGKRAEPELRAGVAPRSDRDLEHQLFAG